MPINNQCIKWRANGINSSSFAQNSEENEAWSSCSLCLDLLIRGPLQGISAWCYHDCLLEFHKGEGEWERQKEKGTNSSNKWIINGYLTATHRCRHSKCQPLGLLQKKPLVNVCVCVGGQHAHTWLHPLKDCLIKRVSDWVLGPPSVLCCHWHTALCGLSATGYDIGLPGMKV